jgi:organic hydroperoxide reductase OsmC/OhrA
MAHHTATIDWNRNGAIFSDGKYSRGHTWTFDGGITVPASSAPDVIKPPLSVVEAIDPEEAVVAALAGCHMLWFLALAKKGGFVVDSYHDEPFGEMGKNAEGKTALLTITLRPRVTFSGEKRPTAAEFDALQHESHDLCYVANTLKCDVRVEAAIAS